MRWSVIDEVLDAVEYQVCRLLLRTERKFLDGLLSDECHLIRIHREARLLRGYRVGTDEVCMLLRQFLT